MPESLCAQWDAALHATLESGAPQSIEFAFESPDGTRQFQAMMVPERGTFGTIETVLCIAHDVTDIRRSEAELRSADKRKDDFLAMLSHELRNPLAPLRTACKVLEREQLSEQGRLALQIGGRQLHHVTRIVDDLLEVSRIARGKIRLQPERVIAQSVIRSVVDGMATTLEERSQRLSLELPIDPLWVTADPVRLAQIVYNLLTNASKYGIRGGNIVVRLRLESGEVLVEVEDDGIGIAPANLTNVFELFSQIEASSARSRDGLGLGLALVKRLAELHGGRVDARSDGPGRGSTFTVALPHGRGLHGLA
jgi:signal transduction histidine kinase